jgi:lipopolysaccharide/colanic/teichoic acid biosynthesis glycosyltransferase
MAGEGDWRRAAKRGLDIVVAGAALVVLSPVLGAIALLVRLRMGRPVLFTQKRLGLRGKRFAVLKFRTMSGATDEHGVLRADAERLTPLGRTLRATSLDELPELVNVLRGDMSLVGPRPFMAQYEGLYSPQESRRHDVRPGITGWAQVNGRNALRWEDRFALDVWYVDHWSLALDARILFRTLQRVVRRDGITSADHVTSPFFDRDRPPGEGG